MKSILKFTKIASVFVLVLTINSCDLEEPDFSNFSNFKFGKLDGKKLDISFDVKIDNPNKIGFKIKKGNADFLVNDLKLGEVHYTKKMKIKRKAEREYTIPLTLELSDGALIRIAQLATKKDFTFELKGTIKGSTLGFSKTIPISEKRTIGASNLDIFKDLMKEFIK